MQCGEFGMQMEHWIEVNLTVDMKLQNQVLLDHLRPYVERLRRNGTLLRYHFFREPEIRLRVKLNSAKAKRAEEKNVKRLAESLVEAGLVSEWHFGRHGEEGEPYSGEQDRYGEKGWQVAQAYFENGAEVALNLLELSRKGRLENPLWAKGLGNPWEGGDKNPWREREENPLLYHWSRYVHLFTNQLGFNVDEESTLCSKQAERYARISKDFGLKW
jgi:hypothetical protein